MKCEGVVVIDKPSGMTSHDVVSRVRKIFGMKRVGHAGTLDPLATGVLVICLGQATRIVEYLTAATKEYVAGVAFGVTTDSEDVSGRILSESVTSGLTEDQVRTALASFRGRIRQIPPMVSAVHHQGKRLYELARQGIEVEREPREVEISKLELLDFCRGERAIATLEIECSSGTYIRTLAADIGAALGCGAIMTSLRRTRAGAFTVDEAVCLEQLEELKCKQDLERAVHSIPDALTEWTKIALNAEQAADFALGRPIQLTMPSSHSFGGLVLLLDCNQRPLGIARSNGDNQLAPVKVFAGNS